VLGDIEANGKLRPRIGEPAIAVPEPASAGAVERGGFGRFRAAAAVPGARARQAAPSPGAARRGSG
jgi:hypothetical protein